MIVIVILAHEGLLMLAADIVPHDAILIVVVKDGQAVFVALGVVGLLVALAARVRPVIVIGADRCTVAPDEVVAIPPARRPGPPHPCVRHKEHVRGTP